MAATMKSMGTIRRIFPIGNGSIGLTLPRHVLRTVGWGVNTWVEISPTDDRTGIILKPDTITMARKAILRKTRGRS